MQIKLDLFDILNLILLAGLYALVLGALWLLA
jgi:hypothetical protein